MKPLVRGFGGAGHRGEEADLFTSRTGLALAVVVTGGFPSPAFGEFPGRNCLLAVQPSNGRGLARVAANGHGQHLVVARGVPRRSRGFTSQRPCASDSTC